MFTSGDPRKPIHERNLKIPSVLVLITAWVDLSSSAQSQKEIMEYLRASEILTALLKTGKKTLSAEDTESTRFQSVLNVGQNIETSNDSHIDCAIEKR